MPRISALLATVKTLTVLGNVRHLFSDYALVQKHAVVRSISVVEYSLNRITTPGANNSDDEVSTSQHLAP